MSLEEQFDAAFAAALALQEKQIQQSYRPVIGVHKWFARRPGTLFRNLLLAEYNGAVPLRTSFYSAHRHEGVIADPFMGGGTPLVEANRLGFDVIGADVNPMAYWIVRQELSPLDDERLLAGAQEVIRDVEAQLGRLYATTCEHCGRPATAKYFLWVKTAHCPDCGQAVPLFPGYLLAEAVRHPRWVYACPGCLSLVELDERPTEGSGAACPDCGSSVAAAGTARRGHVSCPSCGGDVAYPRDCATPPEHLMWAIEYHCETCKPTHKGRFFKPPSEQDRRLFEDAREMLTAATDLEFPEQSIPPGDETSRLLRWGYGRYRDMFNERQLLGLGILLKRIRAVDDTPVREALLTVFSDTLRYQNMLCRYDTYALKCQDVFAVHGFPVGLVQCENNLLGIPGIGSGGFAHFVEKYRRAKAYCRQPFESHGKGARRRRISIAGEQIAAEAVSDFPDGSSRQALLRAASATELPIPPDSLDGVFTDPPYFANVQYAELMDFCYVWLRLGLQGDHPEFRSETTRSAMELTGNITLGRDLAHFTDGLSRIYRHYAAALKGGGPFVFTYHHNELEAYAPLVVAVLDAGLVCTAVLPAPAEMGASLHINGTGSSILDSVFVCRKSPDAGCPDLSSEELRELLLRDCAQMIDGGVRLTVGDVRCMANGHLTRLAITELLDGWDAERDVEARLDAARSCLSSLSDRQAESLSADTILAALPAEQRDEPLALF